ncbi:MAG: hypothetical protein JNL66_09910 [Alphaproteobacteria bacterium]|nr:hypothetical protein [Alphaproteobacteria bacterium]
MDNATRLRDLVSVIGRLIGVMDQETQLLRAMRTDLIAGLQPEKTRLAGLYVGMVKDIRKQPELLAAVGAAARAELTAAMTRFEAAAGENEKAIAAARAANERVLKAIVAAVHSKRSIGTYSSKGGIAEPPRPQRATALSIAIDRTF